MKAVIGVTAGLLSAAYLGRRKQGRDTAANRTNADVQDELPSSHNQRFTSHPDPPNGWVLRAATANDDAEFEVDAKIPPNDKSRRMQAEERLKKAIQKSRDLCFAKCYEDGIPGLVVGVSVNGRIAWKHGNNLL